MAAYSHDPLWATEEETRLANGKVSREKETSPIRISRINGCVSDKPENKRLWRKSTNE